MKAQLHRGASAARLVPLSTLLALGACTSVLGIEDLHQEPRPGGGGSANGNAGTSTANAGSSDGGKAGSNSGSAQGGSNTPGAGTSAGGNNTGGSAAGGVDAGGSGGAPPTPTAGPVHGTLIDFWGRTLSNITLQIGGTITSTDRDGKFTFAVDVPAEYDVSLKLEREAGGKVYGWVYQGLTRRDPTLQVYQARDDRDTDGYVTITSEDAVGTNDTISGAWGTADGSYEKRDLDTSQNGNYFNPKWQGAATNMGTAHALLWSKNAANGLPSAYKSYEAKLIALEASTDASMSFALEAATIPSGNVTGTVSPVGAGDRVNGVFVRFKSGASFTLVSQTPDTDAFSYVVPQLTDASISVTANETDSNDAFSVVHKDGLSPGDATGELVIPAPAAIMGPTGTAAESVDDATPFTFRGSADSPGAYVVHVEADDYYQSLYIVTQKTTFTLPKVLNGTYSLTSGRLYRWQVETHGSFKTVDEMARAGGFLDSYSGPTNYSAPGKPMGTKQESGSYTCTAPAYFTLK
jgi:hypothetical protein